MFDDSFTHFQYTHNTDEIHATAKQIRPDVRVFFTSKREATGDFNVKLIYNGFTFFFEEIRYELTSVEVDRYKM